MRSTFNTMHSRAHCLTLAVVDRAEDRRSCAIHGQNDVEGQRSTPTRRGLVCPPGMCFELLSQLDWGLTRQSGGGKVHWQIVASNVSLHRERSTG